MAERKTPVVLTENRFRELEQELHNLKTVVRPAVAERINYARSFHDLSENAEYDEAKNEQAFIEGKISTIEAMLRAAHVIASEDISTEAAGVGTIVKVYDNGLQEEVEFHIVGATEADPLRDRISYESPVGKALLGKKIGETAEIQAPIGIISMKIMDIRRA